MRAPVCAARYKVTRKIADGGMAELYLGVQRGAAGFERPIVIKRVREAWCADPATREALVDEAHVAMSLNHSNIVQVLDLGFSAGRYFLVLELVDGWDLSVVLDRAGQAGLPMPPELSLHLAAEVCRALAFAHGKARDGVALRVVHRDVNPHNVLLSEQGEVKLTDFGIATARTKRKAHAVEGDGVVRGKLGFMSPEQAAGEDLDARADIFSLGCTLYLLSTGLPPFAGGTDLEMLQRMEQCAWRPLAEVAPDLPAELGSIIRKTMQKSRSDRYPGAEAMLSDLERVQRSAFRPAGQSELKAWLCELARRDQIPTIAKRPGNAAAQGELAQGATLVLEEIESDPGAPSHAHLPRTLTPNGAPKPAFAAPPPLPPRAPTPAPVPAARPPPLEARPVARQPTPAPPAPTPAPKPAEPPKPLLAAPPPETAPAPAPRLAERVPTPAAAAPVPKPAPRPSTAAPPLEPPALPRIFVSAAVVLLLFVAALIITVFVARPNPRQPATAQVPAVVLAVAPDAGAAVPDSSDAGALSAGDSELVYPALRAAAEVMVLVESTPGGANVIVNGRHAGASPLQIKLRAGHIYEVRFEKAGFRPLSRHFVVPSGKKPPRIAVQLEKIR